MAVSALSLCFLLSFRANIRLPANFKRLIPLASHNDARVIAVNRLVYPGSSSHSEADVALLTRAAAAPAGDVAASEDLQTYWRARARDVFDYLASLILFENIPAVEGTGEDAKGGIVLAGWSFGVVWITALLAHIANFAHSDTILSRFLRRVVLYGMPSRINLGFCFADSHVPRWIVLLSRPTASALERVSSVPGPHSYYAGRARGSVRQVGR